MAEKVLSPSWAVGSEWGSPWETSQVHQRTGVKCNSGQSLQLWKKIQREMRGENILIFQSGVVETQNAPNTRKEMGLWGEKAHSTLAHTCMHTHTHAHMHALTCNIHTHTHLYLCTLTQVHKHTYTDAHTYTLAHVLVHAHVFSQLNILTHTCTSMPSGTPAQSCSICTHTPALSGESVWRKSRAPEPAVSFSLSKGFDLASSWGA